MSDHINPSVVKRIVASQARIILAEMGFSAIDEFKFVRSSTQSPVKEVALVWFGRSECELSCGWVAPFVPVPQPGTLRWQRTDKSICHLDVCPQPWNYEEPFSWGQWSVSMFNSEAQCMHKARDIVSKSIEYASGWWRTVSSTSDLISVINSLKERGGKQRPYWNQPRLQLTIAFCLAHSGQVEDAQRALAEYCARFVDEKRQESLLMAALEEASAVQPSVTADGSASASLRQVRG